MPKLTDQYDDEGGELSRSRSQQWTDWVLSKRYRATVRSSVTGWLYESAEFYHPGYAVDTPTYHLERVYVGSNIQGGDDADHEHDAYIAMAELLLNLARTEDDATVDLTRQRWRRPGGKFSHDHITSCSVGDLNQEQPDWQGMGTLPLAELLKARSFASIAPDAQRSRMHLVRAKEIMRRRRDSLALDDEVTEQDLCGYCGKPATSYTPGGRPRCDEHGVRE